MTKQRQRNTRSAQSIFEELFKQTNPIKRWSPEYIRVISLGDRDIPLKCVYEVEDADPVEINNQVVSA